MADDEYVLSFLFSIQLLKDREKAATNKWFGIIEAGVLNFGCSSLE
jgi:hypothetical protein